MSSNVSRIRKIEVVFAGPPSELDRLTEIVSSALCAAEDDVGPWFMITVDEDSLDPSEVRDYAESLNDLGPGSAVS